MIDTSSERVRFEALTPEQAKEILVSMEGKEPALRSCWYCNGAHEHLKSADYPIRCLWGCDGWYLKGFPAPIVTMRARNEPITDEVMQKVVTYTTERE